MSAEILETCFAPAERADLEILEKQADTVLALVDLPEILNAIPSPLVILNNMRQIVFANMAMQVFAGREDDDDLLGLRPGEALNCIHSREHAGGCGTTEFCRTCGAVNAILNSQNGSRDVKECRISRDAEGESLDLLITATSLMLDSQEMTIYAAEDISHQKRREALERTFFHDIMNTAGGVYGLAGLLEVSGPEELDEIKELLSQQTKKLIDEINFQRELLLAERGELEPIITTIGSEVIIKSTVDLYRNHEVAEEKHIEIRADSQDISLQSDETLLYRVLGNMLKNALEAVGPGEKVTVGCLASGEDVVFQVNNPGLIPKDIQLQIFQRSFSTKGSGRGVGTYSIRLLGERYLKGKVSFSSSTEEGTTFEIHLPATVE